MKLPLALTLGLFLSLSSFAQQMLVDETIDPQPEIPALEPAPPTPGDYTPPIKTPEDILLDKTILKDYYCAAIYAISTLDVVDDNIDKGSGLGGACWVLSRSASYRSHLFGTDPLTLVDVDFGHSMAQRFNRHVEAGLNPYPDFSCFDTQTEPTIVLQTIREQAAKWSVAAKDVAAVTLDFYKSTYNEEINIAECAN